MTDRPRGGHRLSSPRDDLRVHLPEPGALSCRPERRSWVICRSQEDFSAHRVRGVSYGKRPREACASSGARQEDPSGDGDDWPACHHRSHALEPPPPP